MLGILVYDYSDQKNTQLSGIIVNDYSDQKNAHEIFIIREKKKWSLIRKYEKDYS